MNKEYRPNWGKGNPVPTAGVPWDPIAKSELPRLSLHFRPLPLRPGNQELLKLSSPTTYRNRRAQAPNDESCAIARVPPPLGIFKINGSAS
jgi:hypothetical protein